MTPELDNIIEITKSHFMPYCKKQISDGDAFEILDNFSNFAKLMLKLEAKRQNLQKQKGA